MYERTPDVQARTFRWYAVFPAIRTFPRYRNRAYPMVMPMKSTRYTSSSGLFAHPGTEAPRVSFGGGAGAGGSAGGGFCLRAEGGASSRLVVPSLVPAEGGDAGRAALSCGAADTSFASGCGIAAG